MNILLRQPESLMSEYSSVTYAIRTKPRYALRRVVMDKVFHLASTLAWGETYFAVLDALPVNRQSVVEALLDE